MASVPLLILGLVLFIWSFKLLFVRLLLFIGGKVKSSLPVRLSFRALAVVIVVVVAVGK